jgi:hypothetical protein
MSLIDPFGWQISTFMAWSIEKGKKGLFMGPGFFGGRMVQPHKVSVATGNLWAVSDTEGLFGFSG